MKRTPRTEGCPHRDDGSRCQWCIDEERADAAFDRWKDERELDEEE